MIGALAARNNLRVKNARRPVGALFYISSSLEHFLDFWAEFELFFCFLGNI